MDAFFCFKNANRKVQRENHLMRTGLAEMNVGVVQESCDSAVRCAVGTTVVFKVKVRVHQESDLSPFMFALVVDRLTHDSCLQMSL